MAMTAGVGEKGRLISSSKVEGTSVVNANGDDLGHITEIMIEKLSGKVAYAVLKYGSIAGLGGKLFAVPWDILTYDTRFNSYLINMAQDRLEKAPSFDENNPPDFADPTFAEGVHKYYGSKADWFMKPV